MNYKSLSETDRSWATEMIWMFRTNAGRPTSTAPENRLRARYDAAYFLAGVDLFQQEANFNSIRPEK